MAKKNATTPKSAEQTAKRSPLSNTAVRLCGAFLAFIGILLCIEQRFFINASIILLVSVACIVGGFFIAVSNLRKLLGKGGNTGSVVAYFLLGLLCFVGGILIAIYRGQIAEWFIILVGSLVAAYGLILLIRFVVRPRSKRWQIFDIIVASLTLVTGILLAILSVSQIASASDGVCFIIFGAISAAVGALELVFY